MYVTLPSGSFCMLAKKLQCSDFIHHASFIMILYFMDYNYFYLASYRFACKLAKSLFGTYYQDVV